MDAPKIAVSNVPIAVIFSIVKSYSEIGRSMKYYCNPRFGERIEFNNSMIIPELVFFF